MAAWVCVVALWCELGAACVFSPNFPVEEGEPNLPPFIGDEFVVPEDNNLIISRRGAPRTFSVTQLFDINGDQLLTVSWTAGFDAPGVLTQSFSTPDPNNQSLYLDIFHRYTGASYTLDPCQPPWSGQGRNTLTITVADGPAVANGTTIEPANERVFVDNHSWTIDFIDQCPSP